MKRRRGWESWRWLEKRDFQLFFESIIYYEEKELLINKIDRKFKKIKQFVRTNTHVRVRTFAFQVKQSHLLRGGSPVIIFIDGKMRKKSVL